MSSLEEDVLKLSRTLDQYYVDRKAKAKDPWLEDYEKGARNGEMEMCSYINTLIKNVLIRNGIKVN